MTTIWSRAILGFKAFREAFVTASHLEDSKFEEWEARILRYSIFWAFYENTVYRDIHKWAQKYRTDHALYKYIRNIYNPSYRLGEFWKTHLMGGVLDPMAGDGKFEVTALPIIVPDSNQENDQLVRAALAQIWDWSKWQIKKDLMTLFGPVLGDVCLMVVDDTEHGEVYLDVVHPGLIKDVDIDRRGNIKGYVLVDVRIDPEDQSGQRAVEYREEATRDGDKVVYKTFKNNKPYAWDDDSKQEEWTEDYGFIPMVMVQHNDVGLDFGWSEIHPGRGKFHEIDDLASKTHDHIRKSVDPMWFLSGVSKPKDDTKTRKPQTEPTTDRPQPGRDELPAIYATNPQARANAMVAELDLGAVVSEIKGTLEEIERDYPELQMDVWKLQTDSGRALRLARQRSEVKVIQRRPSYDEPLVRIQKMAMSIGGMRGYDAFKGIDLESFGKGALTHFIGKRPVYSQDPLDDLELEEQFWKNAGEALEAGVPLVFFLARSGWHEDDIKALQTAIDEEEPEEELEDESDEGTTEEVEEGQPE